jgi:hypothetical protein
MLLLSLSLNILLFSALLWLRKQYVRVYAYNEKLRLQAITDAHRRGEEIEQEGFIPFKGPQPLA